MTNVHIREINMMAEDAEENYPLHESIFNGDLARLSKLLRSCDVTKKDIHGMLGLNMSMKLSCSDLDI